MVSIMKVLVPVALALPIYGSALAARREAVACPRTESLKVRFNEEALSAYYVVIDARDEVERREDRQAGHLKGPVTVFFQGHAQRPSDAPAFTSRLALMSRSGIVVIPVCDTPYGKDKAWRGDRGKEVVLMETVRHVLSLEGIRVAGYSPLNTGNARLTRPAVDDRGCPVSAGLLAIGWSHGGILARRFAHSYPGSVVGLGQVCPAGYELQGSLRLTGRFGRESLRISKLAGSGHRGDALRSAWGFTKGFAGDFARSLKDAVTHAHPAKVFRAGKDIRDCSLYCDGSLFALPSVERVAVIFGADDTCMSPGRILGRKDVGEPSPEVRERFGQRYFAHTPGERLCLDVLPGTHLAPVSHSNLYARTILDRLGMLPVPEGKEGGLS